MSRNMAASESLLMQSEDCGIQAVLFLVQCGAQQWRPECICKAAANGRQPYKMDHSPPPNVVRTLPHDGISVFLCNFTMKVSLTTNGIFHLTFAKGCW
jgi:hypothetical protein